MGYATANTSWPNSVSASVKDLLNQFFTLTDTKDPNTGERLVQDIFVPEDKFYV